MTARSKTTKTRVRSAAKRRPPPTPAKRKAATKAADAPKERRVAKRPSAESYFVSGDDKEDFEFFSTGCSALDAILGGGFCLGRTSNVVGDKSAGKTLLAMEATANFCMTFDDGVVRYAEAEAAFDKPYAGALGIPLDRIAFNATNQPMATVEELYEDMVQFMDKYPGVPKLYIIDSLDSVSTQEEMEGEFNKASFGGEKPKAIGQLFRRLIDRMQLERMHFMVVSQIRDVMNAKAFQQTKTRSGGKALDFYASWILWLTEIGKIKRTVGGIDRITGLDVKGQCRKNKVGLPWRTVEWPVLFGYGIDDMTASVHYLIENKREKRLLEVDLPMAGYALKLLHLRDQGGAAANEMRAKLGAIVHEVYSEVETSFLPKASKY